MTGNYNPEIIESFEGTVVNVQKWTQSTTTFIPTQSTIAGYNTNSTSLNTASAVHILQSQRLYYKMPRVPIHMKQRLRMSAVANSVIDFGFGVPTNTTTLVTT
jgi:hypothetical protein